MRTSIRALLGVLITCASLSACASLTGGSTAFTADSGGAAPSSEMHAMRFRTLYGGPLSAPMLEVDCIAATSTPCVTSGNPGNGSEGDPAWLAFGKANSWGEQLGLFANDAANQVLATPDGVAGIPGLRAASAAAGPVTASTGTEGLPSARTKWRTPLRCSQRTWYAGIR